MGAAVGQAETHGRPQIASATEESAAFGAVVAVLPLDDSLAVGDAMVLPVHEDDAAAAAVRDDAGDGDEGDGSGDRDLGQEWRNSDSKGRRCFLGSSQRQPWKLELRMQTHRSRENTEKETQEDYKEKIIAIAIAIASKQAGRQAGSKK